MYKTGYDPQAFVAFFEKLEAKEKEEAWDPGEGFRHPSADARPHREEPGRDLLYPAAPNTYIVGHLGIQRRETRLARIENRRKIIDNKDNSKPSLRRTSTGDDKSQTDNGDGRPTLNRRDDHQ